MQFTAFDTSDELATRLARAVAKKLSAAVEKNGKATLAVSGGTTPVKFFRALATQDIDWTKITITLVDERFVPPDSQRSNQRLVTIELLQGHAAKARFLPLYREASIEDAVEEVALQLTPRLPIDVVVLGMGTDGHTASLFPGANRLREAVDMGRTKPVIAIEAPGAGEARITLTLAAIASARAQFLHIEGAEKRTVFDAAQLPDDAMAMPVRFVLEHCPDLKVFWAG